MAMVLFMQVMFLQLWQFLQISQYSIKEFEMIIILFHGSAYYYVMENS